MSDTVINIIKCHKAKAVSALALVAAGCASHRDFAYYDEQYPPASYSEVSYRGGEADFGIDAARRAHRLYPEYKAERLDGHCERSIHIRRGETLSDIAEFCDVPVAALIDANPQIRNPREVAAGEQLFIPPVKGHVYAGSSGRLYQNEFYTDNYTPAGVLERDGSRDYYIVRRGDTLAQISYMYDVPLYEIEDLNPGLRPRSLGVGDRVYLPEYARLDPNRRAHHGRRAALADGPPIISIYPARGPRNGRIHVVGDNFRPDQDVTVYYGDDRDDLGRLKVAEANGDGRIDQYLNLPDTYDHNEAYFAVRGRDNSGYVMSEPYAIDNGYDGRDDRIAASGPYRDGYQVDRRGPGPRLSAMDHDVYWGDRVRLSADGFPPDTPVSIYGGPSRSELIKVAETRSDRRGNFNADVAIPDNVNGESALFVAAIEDGPRTIYSDKVRVRTRDGGGRYDSGYDDGYVSSAYPLDESRIDNSYTGRAQLERGVDHGGLLDSGLFSRFRHHNLRHEINVSGGESAVSGVLTNEGVDCPALRDDAGNLYSLLGDLHGFDNGDRVLVKGSTAADDRICGQAQTIQVFTIEKAPW